MKYLLFIIVFVFVGFAAVAQEETNLQDTVYLKNENVITGTVLNPGSEGSIQVRTKGNSIIYVSPTQIDHIALHNHYVAGKNQQSPDQVIQRKLIDDQFNFSVWGGLAAPGGSFGSSIGQYPGFAKTGWMMQAATWVRVKDQLFWSTQFAFARNAFNDTEFSLAQEAQSGLNVYNFYASNWDAVHINTGITWSTELNNDFQLFLHAHLGLIRLKTPEIRFYATNGQDVSLYMLDRVKANGISNDISVGLVYKNRYSASLSILNSRVIVPYNTQSALQPYRIFGLQLGYYILRLSN